MRIEWIHIPEQRDKMLPEQWQARMTVASCDGQARSVAVLRDNRDITWNAVMIGPSGELSAVAGLVAVSLQSAQSHVAEKLETMGWK